MPFTTDQTRRAAFARMRSTATESPGKKPPRILEKNEISLATLRKIHASKPLGAQVLDNIQGHARTTDHHDESAVKAWLRNGGDLDIIDVDDPDSEYRAARAKRDAPKPGRSLGQELVIITLPRDPSARGRRMNEAMRKRRNAGIEALQRAKEAVKTEARSLHRRQHSGDLSTREREALDRLTRRIGHIERIEKAYKQGEYLVLARKSDEALAKRHARVLQERFDLDPRSMVSAVVMIGTTNQPGVYGYTHKWSPEPGVPGDFIALNSTAVTKNRHAKASREAEASTLTHEQIHVLRGRESGRTQPETRGVANYGQDRDVEEKYTVLEEQIRSAPPGTKKTDSYYSALKGDPLVPLRVGAIDNMIARNAGKPAKERRLRVVQHGMHKRGDQTHIARLHRTQSSGWGTIPESQEGIDRVFSTHDGDSVHVFNPRGARLQGAAAFVDSLDGKMGDQVFEYEDGKKVPVPP